MGKRILVVDDDDNFTDFVVRTLAPLKHAVATAHSPDAALAAARTERPDLILLDIGLPGMDGTDLCEMLREDGIPILFVSGHPYRQERLRVEYTGAIAYIEKPVKAEALLYEVKRALRATATGAAPRPQGGASRRKE